jgi:glycosyltransferase involved in cell wall biosynthesis
MKVSVCIPTFNQAAFIKQSILSSYNQTIKPFEIIVFDDCSTDQTAEILQSLLIEVPSLRVFTQPNNTGIARNVDACLRAATGDFIVRLDSDDYLFPEYIEKLTRLLIENPQAGYAHASVQEVDQHNNYLKLRQLARKSGFQNSDEALNACAKGFRVAANILTFRKSALIKAGYIATITNFAEDYYLVCSIAAEGFGNVYLNETLACYRVWVDTGKIRQRRKLDEIIGYRKLFTEVLEPAYRARNWDTSVLDSKRTDFACRHSDCLSWDIYTINEKIELKKELFHLSSSNRVKFCSWLYLNGLGGILTMFEQAKIAAKNKLKTLIRRVGN